MIPALLVPGDDPKLKPYPNEPRLTETEDRGILSGSRTEQIVYEAQADRDAELPEISLDWFNLETGAVETATLSPVTLSVAAAPRTPPQPEAVLRIGFALLFATALFWFAGRKLHPVAQSWFQTRWTQYKASPAYAFLQLKRAVRRRNLADCYAALEEWSQRSSLPAETEALKRALTEIGAQRYAGRVERNREDWAAARTCLPQLNRTPAHDRSALPQLNPPQTARATNH